MVNDFQLANSTCLSVTSGNGSSHVGHVVATPPVGTTARKSSSCTTEARRPYAWVGRPTSHVVRSPHPRLDGEAGEGMLAKNVLSGTSVLRLTGFLDFDFLILQPRSKACRSGRRHASRGTEWSIAEKDATIAQLHALLAQQAAALDELILRTPPPGVVASEAPSSSSPPSLCSSSSITNITITSVLLLNK